MSDLQCPEMVVLMWHKKFQDGFSNLKDDSHPGQPKVVFTNANIASLASLIKRDTRVTVNKKYLLKDKWRGLNGWVFGAYSTRYGNILLYIICAVFTCITQNIK